MSGGSTGENFTRDSRWFRLGSDGQSATSLELFFDLVYVFAITQLASLLVGNPTSTGFVHVGILLFVVWWAWNYTTWMTNWYDPNRIVVRIMIFFTMFLSMLMAIAVPTAFTSSALLFAGSYVLLQVSRNLFNVLTVDNNAVRKLAFVRILVWSIVSGIPWIVGALVDDLQTRTLVWLIALAFDLAGPMVRYWIPVAGASATSDWGIDGHHFAERFQLLIIIALGEGIVVIGSTAVGTQVTNEVLAAICVGFVTTFTLWWLYFDYIAETAQNKLRLADDSGRIARDGFTYLHLPIVAGIIAYGASLKVVISHPSTPIVGGETVVMLIGPILYLVGHNLFRLRMAGSLSMMRMLATAAILATGLFMDTMSALESSIVIMVILVVLAAYESIHIRRYYHSLPEDKRPEVLKHLGRYIEADREYRSHES